MITSPYIARFVFTLSENRCHWKSSQIWVNMLKVETTDCRYTIGKRIFLIFGYLGLTKAMFQCSSDSLWISASEFLGAEKNGETVGDTSGHICAHNKPSCAASSKKRRKQNRGRQSCSCNHLSRFCAAAQSRPQRHRFLGDAMAASVSPSLAKDFL